MPIVNLINNDNLTKTVLATITNTAQHTLKSLSPTAQTIITINCVNTLTSADYNTRFRNKSGPTNVLSFPENTDDNIGTLIICSNIINQETQESGI